MSGVEGIAHVRVIESGELQAGSSLTEISQNQANSIQFSDLLSVGIERVEESVETSSALVRRFAGGENVPIHEVTMALHEAQYSVQLALQVRDRLVEAYRDVMNMQL